jgi:hypothetical protein
METSLTVKEVSHRPVRDSFLRVGVGVGIGALMALAASGFLFIADSIKHFSEFIERIALSYGSGWTVMVSPVFLLVAAFLIYGLRRTLGVKRFHGPAETIQAAQSGENVDIRIGFGSTLAALISDCWRRKFGYCWNGSSRCRCFRGPDFNGSDCPRIYPVLRGRDFLNNCCDYLHAHHQ